MMSRTSPSEADLRIVATEWLVKFEITDHPDRLWFKFRKWVRESPAHREALSIAYSRQKVAYAYVRTLAAGAGEREKREFHDTLVAELAGCPRLFGK